MPTNIDFTATVTANSTQPTQPPVDGYLPDAPAPIPQSGTLELTAEDYERFITSSHPLTVSNYYVDRFIPINPSDPPPIIAADVNQLALDSRLRQITHAIRHCEQWSNVLDPTLKSIASYVLEYARYALLLGRSVGDPKWDERDLCRMVFHPEDPHEQLFGIWWHNEHNCPLPIEYEASSESFLEF